MNLNSILYNLETKLARQQKALEATQEHINALKAIIKSQTNAEQLDIEQPKKK